MELKGLGASRGKLFCLSIHCVLFGTPSLSRFFFLAYIYTYYFSLGVAVVNIRSHLHGGNTSLSSISSADSHRH